MALTTEITAPVFNLKDVYGREINLQNYKDKKVLIGFFRHAGCPFCNLRVHSLTKEYEMLKSQGMEMIFFFESKESIILRSTFHQEVSPIPIISDPEKKIYAQYGLEKSFGKSTVSHLTSFIQTVVKANKAGVPIHWMAAGESFSTMPAEFLLQEGLVIKKLLYSTRLNERMDLEEIKYFANTGKVFNQ